MNRANEIGWMRQVLWGAGGIGGPLVCLAVELATRMCRKEILDPLPTGWHVLLVLMIPVATVLAWRAMKSHETPRAWHALLVGCALCTALLYSLQFLPFLPIAILLVPAGVGVLALAPHFTLLALAFLAWDLHRRERADGRSALRRLGSGFLLGVLVLALADFQPMLTVWRVQDRFRDERDTASEVWLREHADRATLEDLAVNGRTFAVHPLCYLSQFRQPLQSQFMRQHWTLFTGEQELPASVRERLVSD